MASRKLCSAVLMGFALFAQGNAWLCVPASAIEFDDPEIYRKQFDSAGSTANPVEVYHKVWELIKDSYYDPALNSQDWSRWEHKYDRKIVTRRDAQKAMETMLASLGDRYTRYLDESEFDDERAQIEALFYGVGIHLGVGKTGRVSVIAPIPGTPAAKAGLQTGDEIAAIDGTPVPGGMPLEQAVRHIRGPKGTKVVLTIVRGNQRKQFSLKRDEIAVHGVSDAMMLDKRIGYIRISTFISHDGPKYIREAIDQLRSASGIIVDLRNNPGGLLANALAVSSLFIEEGVVSITAERDGKQTPMYAEKNCISQQPIVILVDKGTASAAEITASALRDHGRATLVGEATYGKGLIQGITRLHDGAGVNITIGQYLSPAGHEINDGVTPDYEVKISPSDQEQGLGPWFSYGSEECNPKGKKDIQLGKALEVLRAKLDAPAQCVVQGRIDHSTRRSFITSFRADVVGLFTGVFRATRRFFFNLFDDNFA